jgi:hypothetical protein
VTRHRGGTAGSDSVNEPAPQEPFVQYSRRLNHASETVRSPKATSLGRVVTQPFTAADGTPHPGHATTAAVLTTYTRTAPSRSSSTPATRTSSSPRRAEAISSDTRP